MTYQTIKSNQSITHPFGTIINYRYVDITVITLGFYYRVIIFDLKRNAIFV